MKQCLVYVCLVVAGCISGSCLAQTITIRVISGKNGRPLVKQIVTVSLLYAKDEPAPADYHRQLKLVTDTKGMARFVLPEPPPAHISASVHIDGYRWRCACMLLDSTENVVKIGVLKFPSNEKNGRPKPGEIMFVVQPQSLFYRFLGPLEKD